MAARPGGRGGGACPDDGSTGVAAGGGLGGSGFTRGGLREQLAMAQASNTEKQQQLEALQNQIEQVTVAGAATTAPADRDEEAGGILVDRDYVIFIVDTSGSMRELWGRVYRAPP